MNRNPHIIYVWLCEDQWKASWQKPEDVNALQFEVERLTIPPLLWDSCGEQVEIEGVRP